MSEFLLLSFFGVFVGFASGFFGIGGGGIIVSVLVFLGYDIKYAIGISVMQMIFSSLFGSYINYKKGMFKFGEGFYVGIGGIFGAFLSGFIVKYTPSLWLECMFASLLFIMIIKAFIKKSFVSEEKKLSKPILIIIGIFVGIMGVSVGIGGGMLISLIFFGFLGYDIKKAVSMGLFFVVFAGISGFISLSINGLVDYYHGFALGIGALIGVYFGTNASIKIDRTKQKRLNLGFNMTLFLLTIKKIFLG
ncbi:sulfite exporter TauE/SafE family protein [Campylobacter fetus]|uniref:Probable membrane transporter protein n=1 Tax=Campylobacter fetus subsp. testudinum TaxID=1507806 RepID=A0AAX0HBC8_CAMFE|nr:sulfite exporter TauE/SafE family protein [Campylobacter fetus]AGZ81241.1 putative membrane protein, sulfite exporter TauE/SafE family [Campylobacter fetus subsp. testudinum 03-427]AJB44996.1 membrane protein [Campylobacter fetus subsp. testudinum]ALV64334.1 hypothetical membrane protein, sulfite exporter TauE/SafE family [Campylobacter fetus subsp. testudinum Sp3]AVK80621.1 sulfite exporter TauE/SafE family protein [Campylobacter fetus subsp. testudinum]EAI4321641.1 sulfite exporter TauE/S